MKKKNPNRRLLLSVILIIVAVVLVFYLIFAFYYRTHFLPNTKVNGIETGGQTVPIVEEEITEQVGAYALTLTTIDGETETISGAAIGITPAFHGELEALLAEQKSLLWPVSLFKNTELSVETLVSYDEAALSSQVDALPCLEASRQIAPTDARISDYTAEGFVVLPEALGSTVDRARLLSAVQSAVATLTPTLSLSEADCYVLPEKTKDDPALLALAEELNSYVAHTITYEMDEESYTIGGETIATWLSAEDNTVRVDEEAVQAFVNGFADETDTYGLARDFKTSSGETITFQSVYYGWKIDRAAETEQLLSDVRSDQNITREPIYQYRGASRGERDYGDTYVEVNLSAQHVYVYKDGSLALDAPCVTGCVGKGTITHVGLYSIYSKETERYLVGENYRSFVNYWMPFNGGEGLHDATWRSSFGGSTYLTSGSHGCVNLSKSVAGEIYELVAVGTPVFIYRMDSTAVATEAQIAGMAVNAINSVGGVVTLSSETALTRARNFYDYLSAENKVLVTNYELLPVYEAQLAELKAQLTAAQEALIAQQQAVIGNE